LNRLVAKIDIFTGYSGNLCQTRSYLHVILLDLDLQSLIAGCIKNNHKDQKFLYENYYGYCLKTVFRYIYHYDKAVDVVNDGFVKIFRNFEKFQFRDIENLEMVLMGWMRMIMINTAIDQLRKHNFLPEIGDISESTWAQEDRSQGSDHRLLYKELVKEIKKLPPSYRTVFNLYVIDGLTHQEIANMLGISVGTSKSNLSKARVILQKIVKTNDQEVSGVCNM
jgi:RNA polymerase sigma factor (sigma-70 family)